MKPFSSDALALLVFSLAAVAHAFSVRTFETHDICFHPKDIIVRDICIVGGGSSGTYSAIRLRDLGKSVVVIEKNSYLGGHAHSYVDPTSGKVINLGVVTFDNLDVVRNYFSRLGVRLVNLSSMHENLDIDFRTGKTVTNETYSSNETIRAFMAYNEQLKKYPYLLNGYNLPDPVPEDLLLPFESFVAKYNLQALVLTIWRFGQGLGNLLEKTTLYVVKLIGSVVVQNILFNSFLQTASGDNSEIYRKALSELGSDVLLRSHVNAVDRSANGSVMLVAQTANGTKLILAKKVIVAIPQKLENLNAFDLDETERSIFGQFTNGAYYTGVVKGTGFADNISLLNLWADTPYNIPGLPAIYSLSRTAAPGLKDVKYGSPAVLPDKQVKGDILDTIDRLKATGIADNNTSTEFVTFSGHVPFELTVSVEAIRAGFYKRLNGLQGYRNTFYTGAAFQAHDSSTIWQYIETLLPQIVASVE